MGGEGIQLSSYPASQLSIYLSIYVSIHPSIYLSIMYLSIYLSSYISLSLSLRFSLYFSRSLPFPGRQLGMHFSREVVVHVHTAAHNRVCPKSST